MTWRTGFLLQGNTQAEEIANTDSRMWKAVRNEAYAPLHYSHGQMRGYFVVGPGDQVDGAKCPWGWETLEYDDAVWPQAENVTRDGRGRGVPREARAGPNMWLLVPRNIPLMENTLLLLNQTHLTMAYPDSRTAEDATMSCALMW